MSEAFLTSWRERVERELDRLLPAESAWPETLHRAIRHSVFAGGKRLRPLLALAAGRACRGDLEAILPAACGLEMIHTYSLIHDDLPALDNDDWRRGVPTCHRQFGEATAILAGDALLTDGLGCLARYPEGGAFEAARLRALTTVVAAIGTEGMIGGQFEDLESEGVVAASAAARERLRRIHEAKTGRLIAASLAVGAILSGAPNEGLQRIDAFGRHLGLAFQIKDDLLDVESSRETLGKETGKDSRRGKLTYPAVFGSEGAKGILEETATLARAAALEIDGSEGPLVYLADYVARRAR